MPIWDRSWAGPWGWAFALRSGEMGSLHTDLPPALPAAGAS